MMTSGKLYMFDGPDGVGKTTQFELVAKALRAQGHDVYTTHLLGGTPIGEALRSIMFSNALRPAPTNLHIALAIYHALAEDLEGRRKAGSTVLVDRSPLSLIAYQVYGDGLDPELGAQACREALAAFSPDQVILYSAPFEVLQSRRNLRHKDTDYFEQQQLDYHRRTLEGYQAAAQEYEATVVAAQGSIDTVHAATMQALNL